MNKEQLNRTLAIIAGIATLVLLVISITWFGLTDIPKRCELLGGSVQNDFACNQIDSDDKIYFLDGGSVRHCSNIGDHVCAILGGSMVSQIGQGAVCHIPCP